MNTRALALAAACALSLSLLTACGGKNDTPAPETPSTSLPAVSTPEVSTPDTSAPDASAPDVSVPEAPAPETPAQPEAAPTLALNKTDFTLKAAGASWKLKAALTGGDQAQVTWTSDNEAVATVAQDGTVIAVAPGTATVTATYGELSAQCIVRCRWEEKVEQPAGDRSESTGDKSEPAAPAQVDLAAFYDTVAAKYQFPRSMELADGEVLDAFYPDLTGIATQQRLVYANMMSMNMGEFALIQVKDGKDVAAVKAILQTRIDDMANGGAWYPEPTRIWSECSKVVSNGNYIMMVVSDSYEAIIQDFNALF